MTRQEFAPIVAAIRTYYSKEDKLIPNKEAMELWFRQLEDLPANVIEAAVKYWVVTNKWSPSIADLREKAAEIMTGIRPDWGEAWESVLRSITRFGMFREKEALDSLDPLTRECVNRIGFQNICMSENVAVERAHFRDIYTQVYSKRLDDARIPPALGNLIESMTQKLIEGA